MNNQQDFEAFQKEILKICDQASLKMATGMSKILRNIEDPVLRLKILEDLNPTPTIKVLRYVKNIAEEEEDYETCEVIKLFLDKQKIQF